ncbi:hypothetical protein [Singulisphaera acidiphila]|uniref:Uncharacterized protein n=1 Tax=Singulisphaera acidiphila (strain ATCC BAA-1392 / DSM 18658 / VKM B-2454 / MOB10) TaxID=886293 RepID=L0DDB6_SINAD|nr:hypothetical protein [Singulisphaera acidiphila]AGA27247.1 hypothetical protein Sinac_2963 [Singulisphaera acidiphila DSM 18658]
MIAPEPKSVAAVITEWRTNSHADVLLSRILEPEAWGHPKPFGLKLAAVYADQFPENELCRSYCQKYNIPIFPTVKGAIGVGTSEVAVDGVILIGEHGQYASNGLEQTLYPRRRLFEEVVHAFRLFKKRVPVFSDKHLSYDWLFSRWMYDLARHEGIPFMAGSSLPVAWRLPALNIPIGTELTEAMAVGYADLEAYGFHALETLQCITERRRGGETGVLSVRCVTGPRVWEEEKAGLWSKALLDELTPARQAAFRDPGPIRPTPSDALFLVNYRDGLKGAVVMLGSVGSCFAFSGRRRDVKEPDAAVFMLEDHRPYGHFGHLLRAIEQMIVTGHPSYPVERTLLTSGLLSALMQSRHEGGSIIATPHLADLSYQPADWPYAPGPVGTPA